LDRDATHIQGLNDVSLLIDLTSNFIGPIFMCFLIYAKRWLPGQAKYREEVRGGSKPALPANPARVEACILVEADMLSVFENKKQSSVLVGG
jgi:hypothetical protein